MFSKNEKRNFLGFLSNRETSGHSSSNSFEFLLNKCKLIHSFRLEDENSDILSPLALVLNRQLAAVATENGSVTLLKKNSLSKVHIWQGHNNAIFDIKWRIDTEEHLLTASGDQSVVLWDTNTCKEALKLRSAHKSSIKSLSFCDCSTFASGGRDGVIKIWDIRCGEVTEIAIPNAHNSSGRTQKHTRRSKSLQQRSDPKNSVTCVLFVPHTNYLFSSGANDATIKLWDLRKLSVKEKYKPVKLLPYLGTTSYTNAHGYTSLALDSHNRLYGSCTDHCIYCYYPSDETSAIKFVGHKTNYYTKINTLGDKYLISGSTDGNANIWSLSKSKKNIVWPSYLLPHGTDEVTAVDCDEYDFSFYTCCDDQRVKQWKVEPLETGYCEDWSSLQCKAQLFERKDVEVENVMPLKRKLSSSPTSHSLYSITNWLQVKHSDEVTPTNAKVPKKCSTTPTKKQSKENMKSQRIKMSKKSLFLDNRKISDYLRVIATN